MKYICKKTLALDTYDDDGFLVENKETLIDVGEVFELSDRTYNHVASNNYPRLENGSRWLEISPETLVKHFKAQLAQEEQSK